MRALAGRYGISTAEVQLFVAIDRSSKLAFARFEKKASRLIATDNDVQFYDQLSRCNGPTALYFRHMFDMSCQENGIEHRLTKPNHP